MDAQVAPETLDRIILQIAATGRNNCSASLTILLPLSVASQLRHRREARLVGGVGGDFRGGHVRARAASRSVAMSASMNWVFWN